MPSEIDASSNLLLNIRYGKKPGLSISQALSGEQISCAYIKDPSPLLKASININEIPALDDESHLTNALRDCLSDCDALVCVLDRQLTGGIVSVLRELINMGQKPSSIFFIVTNMDGYSERVKSETISNIRTELLVIDSRFEQFDYIVMNPKKALTIYGRYQVLMQDYGQFLSHFTEFCNRVLLAKSDSIGAKLRKYCK